MGEKVRDMSDGDEEWRFKNYLQISIILTNLSFLDYDVICSDLITTLQLFSIMYLSPHKSYKFIDGNSMALLPSNYSQVSITL